MGFFSNRDIGGSGSGGTTGTLVSGSILPGHIKINDTEVKVYDDTPVKQDIQSLTVYKDLLSRFGINVNNKLTIDGVEQVGGTVSSTIDGGDFTSVQTEITLDGGIF